MEYDRRAADVQGHAGDVREQVARPESLGPKLRRVFSGIEVGRCHSALSDVRINDLRHSYACRALALGESLPMIGKVLGHRQIEITAR